jgi:hypothetical protein
MVMVVTKEQLLELINLAREMREAHVAHANARMFGPLPDFEEISKNDKASKKRFEAKAKQLLELYK